MSRWSFLVEQDGMVVASGDAPTEAEAKREAGHYAMMYAQDGPVKVSVKEVRRNPTLPREGKAQDEDFPDRFGELPERTRPSIFDGQPPLTEEDKRGYSKEQWAEIIAENKGGSDGVEAGGAAGEDRRTVEAVSKGDDGVESGAVGVGEQKGVDG